MRVKKNDAQFAIKKTKEKGKRKKTVSQVNGNEAMNVMNS